MEYLWKNYRNTFLENIYDTNLQHECYLFYEVYAPK